MADERDRNPQGKPPPAGTQQENLSFRKLTETGASSPANTDRPLPDPDPPTREVDPTPDRMTLYEETTRYLTRVLAAVRNGNPFDLRPGLTIMESMVTLRAPMDALFLRAIHSDDAYDFLINHSVNVAIYAISMAANLGFSHQRQVEIGMVGLLHDVGMAKLPESLIYKTDAFSETERLQFRERPNFGHDILIAFESSHGYLAECALQVHERIDGAGYPRGLRAEEIHEYAQIIGLVDIYEALIHNRPQREKVPHFFAVKEIIKTGKSQFQRQYLKALLNTFSIFPLQSHVRLNSNAIGRVVATDPDQPLRPRLKILFDSHRNRVLTERIVNLTEHPLLYIVDSVADDDLREIRQSADQGGEAGSGAEYPSGSSGERSSSEGDPGRRTHRVGADQRNWRLVWIGVAVVCLAIAAWLTWGGGGDSPKPAVDSGESVSVLPAKPSEQPSQAVPVAPSENMPSAAPSDRSPARTPSGKTTDASTASEPAAPIAPTEQVVVPVTGQYPFALRISGHRRPASAAKVAQQLSDKGLTAYWNRVDLGSNGVWYRVFVGAYPDVATALAAAKRHGLGTAKVKRTPFTAWVGGFATDDPALNEAQLQVRQSGFSSYTWRDPDGNRHLGVGAFYTRRGALDQVAVLTDIGIPARVAKR